uniref:Uncharacterized protein n=1 Tax=Anguilla anguilla TaxID=7936 RepID=A0A0E9WMJ0_ANGAN
MHFFFLHFELTSYARFSTTPKAVLPRKQKGEHDRHLAAPQQLTPASISLVR